MKKYFSLCVAGIVLISSFIGTSCKKRIHSSAPTPNNVRMLGYTKVTTIRNTVPVAGVPSTITEKYRFYYDDNNRVTQMIYTGNDSFEINKRIDFTYKTDPTGVKRIYKKTTNALDNSFVQLDSFILNKDENIETAYTPYLINKYEYLGKLLVRNTRIGTNYNRISMTDNSTYTSVNGDFLKHNFDGKLVIDFTDLTTPLTIKLLTYPDTTDTLSLFSYATLTHTRNGYNYSPMWVYVKDTNNVKDSLQYPGLFWVNEGYHFYTEKANRTGDYMQLESFTMFGKNIFQNSHLVESITSRNRSAAITYDIDAFSKITQTRVVILDSVLNSLNIVYDIQYETY